MYTQDAIQQESAAVFHNNGIGRQTHRATATRDREGEKRKEMMKEVLQ